ncbi:MAG TPA: CFI-box-CTERM domain-containing protein [Polyangiales bacterium]|nr:CFI-box-CTERM domain-containing protein [Polyangiales bacterium]
MAPRLRALAVLATLACAATVHADGAPASEPEPHPILEFHFTPVGYAQLALWIEDAKGNFLSTVRLTEAVANRGIGNRPGASQMNSGFRWPYGRREGVLPVWAHARASAPGAKQFRRVIFQDRKFEGLASRTSDDFSRDDYFCLSFDNSRSKQDALDAVSCASAFNSDKGRFITSKDVDSGYEEPYEDVATHQGRSEPLSLTSLYPPRHDFKTCAPACFEHADVATYDAHVRDVMPDIDAVTMATPMGDMEQQILYAAPLDWVAGDYRACLEINVEGDYNAAWSAAKFPTPTTPVDEWDYWARDYGYPYRGQPSVVYCVPFQLGAKGPIETHVDEPEGSAASWDTASSNYGKLQAMKSMTDDPVKSPGSGADRLMLSGDGYRMKVLVKPPLACKEDAAPSAVEDLQVSAYPNKLHAHEWGSLSFRAASDDAGVFRYDVRVSPDPMVDDASFMRGMPAKNASIAAEELRVPTDSAPGTRIKLTFGGMVQQTHYYVGVRAIDGCAHAGALRVAELTTTKRTFATVTPCFVATAAYGSPLAHEISALRRFRDRQLSSNFVGRGLVGLYYEVGPKLANVIREHESLRAVARTLLSPFVAAASALQD